MLQSITKIRTDPEMKAAAKISGKYWKYSIAKRDVHSEYGSDAETRRWTLDTLAPSQHPKAPFIYLEVDNMYPGLLASH